MPEPCEAPIETDCGNALRCAAATEIATVMLDLVLGRAVPRNLDAHRGVWATERAERHSDPR